jgi:hypothetical protein
MQGLYDVMLSLQVYKRDSVAVTGQGENCKPGVGADEL